MIDVAVTLNQPLGSIPEKDENLLKLIYQQSIVILKNEKATLPLQKDKRYIIEYYPKEDTFKQVIFFLGMSKTKETKKQ
mgnify:CR=1 FL=1